MNAQTLIRQAKAAGVELRLIDGKVKASGHADAVALMVDQLRANKADLIRWFTQSAANDTEPPADPSTWRELAAAYHAHHFQCKACQASGRGANYGQRCDTGLALWLAYQTII